MYVRYWSTGKTTTTLGSIGTVLEKGLDDHVSWWCMNGIGERTRLRRFLVGTELGHGLDDHVYRLCMYGIGVRTRRTHLLVVYVRLWGTE